MSRTGERLPPVNLQELLDLLSSGVNAERVSAALADQAIDLDALLTEARTSVDTLAASDDVTEETVSALELLADGIDAVNAERTRRNEAASQMADRVNAILDRVTTPEAASDSETEAQDAEIVAEVPLEDAPEPEPVAEIEVTPELVAASARPRVNLAQIASRAPRATGPAPTPFALVAAADVPGVPHGRAFNDMNEVAEGALRQLASMPKTAGQPTVRRGLAVINREFSQDLVQDGRNDMEVINRAADQRRLTGNSLVAAGGWCAPSETIYDILCEPETTAGLISIPEVQINRGGIRFTTGPDFSAIWTSTGFFSQTEAEAIAGIVKPCFEIPCPDFTEVRLEVAGVCLTSGILQERGYPEAVARFIRGVMTAHAHRMSALTIARMVAGSTPVALPAAAYSSTIDVLGALELQAWDLRYRYLLDPDTTLEAVMPYWLLGVLRDDLARRNGYDDPYSVTDAEVFAWLSLRGISAQWVYGWQGAWVAGQPNTIDPAQLGGPAPALSYPDTVQVLLYPAGTWVRGVSPVIDIGTLYDSTLLSTNRYQALFTEEAWLLALRCMQSRVLTIPLCDSGATGAQAATCGLIP